MDSLHVDKTVNHFNNDFDVKKFTKQFKEFKDELDTLPNSELEKVISHCYMLIERNNIGMGGA